MNNDYLRVNSKSNDKDIIVGEFKNKPQQQKELQAEKKVTLLTLLSFSRKTSPSYTAQTLRTPNIKGVFSLLFLNAFFSFALCLISFFTTNVILLVFSSAVASLVFPLFIISFAYKLDTTNGVSLIELMFGLIVGVGVFIIFSFFEDHINDIIKFDWVEELISVIIRDILLFIIANIFVSVAKKDNMFDALLLTVAVYAGYLFINSLSSLITSMFLSVQVYNGTEVQSTGAIILGKDTFKNVFAPFMKSIIKDAAFLSAVTSCCAFVNGGLIGLNVSPIKDVKYKAWSLYFLFVLTVVLNIAAIFPSSLQIFEIILKSISIIFSFILAVTVLNYYLSKAKFKE